MTFKNETGVPIVDFPGSFGYTKRKVMMSPMQFFRLARLTSTDESSRQLLLKEYIRITTYSGGIDKALSGLRDSRPLVPTPYLEFKNGKVKDHEGRNRVYAGHLLKRKQIPVWFIWKVGDVVPSKDLSKIDSFWK